MPWWIKDNLQNPHSSVIFSFPKRKNENVIKYLKDEYVNNTLAKLNIYVLNNNI